MERDQKNVPDEQIVPVNVNLLTRERKSSRMERRRVSLKEAEEY
jgi:hypothetical protein